MSTSDDQNTSEVYTPDSGLEESVKKGEGRNITPWIYFSVLDLCVIGIVSVQLFSNDHSLTNILSALLTLVGWLFLLLWLRSLQQTRGLAGILFISSIVGVIGFFVVFKWERFSSEMVPQFSYRFGPGKGELPTESAPDAEQVDSIFAAAETDFNQFLGPDRTGVLTTRVQSDWESNPPKIQWKQPIGEGWSGFAVQGDAAITMEQRDESEWVTAYNIADGTLLWKYVIDAKHTTVPGGAGPRSTPTIDNNRVYACSAVGKFVCLNLTDGSEIWSQDLCELSSANQASFEAEVSWGRSGSPLIVNDKVVIPLGGKETVGGNESAAQPLIAFSAEDGSEVWRAGKGQITYSSPVMATVGGVSQILFVSWDKVAGYKFDTGEQLWEAEWQGVGNANPAVSHPVQVSDNQLLLGKAYGQGSMLLELKNNDGEWSTEQVWKKSSVMKTKFATAVIRDGFAYGLSDGILECIDVSNGRKKWKRGRYKHGQLLLLDDKLLILTEDGELVLVKAEPEKHEELASMKVIDGICWNTISLSGNRLLVRSSDEAACVILPLE